MEVELLAGNSYRGPLARAPDGRSGDSHFALVQFSDGEEERAFVKLQPDQLSVINEITGYILASSAGHAVPQKAALLWVPVTKLPPPVPDWLLDYGADHWPAWCTNELPYDSLKLFYSKATEPVKRELERSEQTPAIVAFDDWVANTDRNTGNLLRVSEGRYALIDHGRILNSQPWPHNPPQAELVYTNKIQTLLGPKADELSFQSRACEEAEQHTDVLARARERLRRWWSLIDTDGSASQNIEQFLDQRAKDSAGMKQRMGLLV